MDRFAPMKPEAILVRGAGAHHPRSVWLLALAASIVVLLGCGALISYAGVVTNRLTADREAQLLHRAIDRNLARLTDDVSSATIWNEAYERTAVKPDAPWMHANFGKYFHDYLHHDITVAFDRDARPIYVSVDGAVGVQPAATGFISAVAPVVAQVRARETANAARSQSLGFHRAGLATSPVKVGDEIYLVAASSVTPEPGYGRPLVPGAAPVVVSAVKMDGAYFKTLSADYGLRAAHLAAAAQGGEAWLPLMGSNGRQVSGVAWAPDRPGVSVYHKAKWTILAVGLLLAVVVGFLILRLGRTASQLLAATVRAQAADQAKSDFVANMSHEIRTPLNGVLGMAQIMEANALTKAQRERLKIIQESGAALLTVLNDILDISKIQAGKLEINAAPFDALDLGRGACAACEGLAAAKHIDLRFEGDPAASGIWVGDSHRLRQVLTNLLSNALKFTEEGSVSLQLQQVPGGLRFNVVDTGIGLESHQIPNLFDKFSQADASTTRRYGGTGLGLAISRDLVRMMGGEIEVASERSIGSSFDFTLPLRRAEGADSPPPSRPPAAHNASPAGRTISILAAEDNPTNQLVLRAMLEPIGVELMIVGDGREAVAAFQSHLFDLVLMDVQMPEMNGVDACRAIRAFERAHGRVRTPILALSANVMAHQQSGYVEAGMDGCVGKPIEMEKLYDAIDGVLTAKELAAAAQG